MLSDDSNIILVYIPSDLTCILLQFSGRYDCTKANAGQWPEGVGNTNGIFFSL